MNHDLGICSGGDATLQVPSARDVIWPALSTPAEQNMAAATPHARVCVAEDHNTSTLTTSEPSSTIIQDFKDPVGRDGMRRIYCWRKSYNLVQLLRVIQPEQWCNWLWYSVV